MYQPKTAHFEWDGAERRWVLDSQAIRWIKADNCFMQLFDNTDKRRKIHCYPFQIKDFMYQETGKINVFGDLANKANPWRIAGGST